MTSTPETATPEPIVRPTEDGIDAVCADCREMQTNRAWVLRALGHPACLTAIKAEKRAARRFWVRYDPRGCAVGSVLAEYVGLLSEDAHKEFTPKVKDRRREAVEGYRHELLTADEWDANAQPCLMGECEHRRDAEGGPR